MIFLKVIPLSSLDVILDYGELGNFRFIMHSYTILISQGKMSEKNTSQVFMEIPSVAGFEMILRRHISHYLITYYLPSGENF